jgi:PAS domain S-box-containing protein
MDEKPSYEELERRIALLERDPRLENQTTLQLLDSEVSYRLILESISDTVIITDDLGNMIYVCPNTTNIFGFSQKEIYALQNIQKLLNGLVCDTAEIKNKGDIENLERSIKNSSGDVRYILIDVKSISIGDGTILYVMHDITDRKKSEDLLRRSEEKFRALFEQAAGYCMILDPNTSDGSPLILDANDAACAAHGYTREEFIGRPVTDIDDEDGKRLVKEHTAEIMTGKPLCIEKTHVRKDGTTFPVELNAKRIDLEDGYALVLTTEYDITERKKAEAQLKESKERFELAMEAVEDGLYDWNLMTNEIYYSPGWKRMLGYRANELPDDFSVWEELTDPEDVRKSKEMKRDLVNKKRDRFEMEFKMKHKDGHMVDILSRAIAIFDDKGKAVRIIGTHVDITERNQLKANLLHAQKMESIGTLAGGIAHEFNNILAIIIGNNELIMQELSQWSQAKKSAEEIRIAGLRARDVVKQLLSFSTQDSTVKKVIDFKFVVQESIKLIRSSTPADIKIEQNLSADTYPVMGNETEINQILINLCNNAYDAMPEKGGIITIELLNETIDKRQTKHQTKLKPGQYVKLMISDNGIGMDNETLERVFEPYFTTKSVGKGTGIGLAVVHGIVERYGGTIIVDSKPARGTTFTIFFPAHKGLFEQKDDKQNTLNGGNECILYVDDEPSLAQLGKLLLERLGYTTESITDPEKALELVRSDPHKFDLLITDMAMPNMTGDQLVIETLKIRQDMPTIICTGYSAKISAREAADIGIRSFIMKPINISELAKIVRQVLDDAKRSKPIQS